MGDVLEATGLRKAFRGVTAVDGVDLRVAAGERLGLLGPNGAGKTTTLLMLLGAISPDAGRVTVLGRSLPKQRSQAMTGVGFVAGYLPLPDRLRVREALGVFAQLYGLDPPAAEEAIDEALARFHIAHLGDRMCVELSSGQRTLVGICKAILHRPQLLVLDEPTASLDPDVALRVREGIHRLSEEEGTALLVTSHNMGEVEELCDRVVFLTAGRVVADGTPTGVAEQFGHGSLEGVFLELAGTVRSEIELADEGLLDETTALGVAQADIGLAKIKAKAKPDSVRPERPEVAEAARPEQAETTDAMGEAPAAGLSAAKSYGRIRAIARRHAFVLRRSPHRWFDIVVWPLVDALLFGSLGVFIARESTSGSGSAASAAYLLTGILLFHVIYQVQIALSTGFLEETWSRNLLNLMTTPLRELEYVLGVALFGFVKMVIGLTTVGVAAVLFFAFNILDVGWGLFPIAIILILCGFAISLFVIGLVLRFGQSAEVLAWGILFVILPMSGVFYPVDALPAVLQPIARLLPTTHAFVAARDLLGGQPMPWDQLAIALVGVVISLALGIAFLLRMLGTFRRRGFVTRFS